MSGVVTEVFGTITPFSDSRKVGLDSSCDTPIVKAVPKNAIAKWTVQAFDGAPDFYRLFVNDGDKDYALSVRDDKASIFAFEGSPTFSDSHVWRLERPESEEYYLITDERTGRAWKLNGEAIELVSLPLENDLDPFKFSITF